jgi:hypothetical protein
MTALSIFDHPLFSIHTTPCNWSLVLSFIISSLGKTGAALVLNWTDATLLHFFATQYIRAAKIGQFVTVYPWNEH